MRWRRHVSGSSAKSTPPSSPASSVNPPPGDATKGTPAVINSATFQSRLRTEEQTIEDDFGTYLRFWPILNLGVKFGLGS